MYIVYIEVLGIQASMYAGCISPTFSKSFVRQHFKNMVINAIWIQVLNRVAIVRWTFKGGGIVPAACGLWQ